jgi:hypothetical protein
LVTKGRENVDHCGTEHVILEIVVEQAYRRHRPCEKPDWIIVCIDAIGPYDIALQQVVRSREQRDILDKERDVAGHCGKAAGNLIPSVRHERDDRNRRHECRAGCERPEDSRCPVPESPEQKHKNCPLHDAQEYAAATDAEDGIDPENKRTVADVGDQDLSFVLEPFLIPKQQEYDHHRRPNEMVVEISFQEAGPCQCARQLIHHCRLLIAELAAKRLPSLPDEGRRAVLARGIFSPFN